MPRGERERGEKEGNKSHKSIKKDGEREKTGLRECESGREKRERKEREEREKLRIVFA